MYRPQLGREIDPELDAVLVDETAQRYVEAGYYTPLISSERTGAQDNVILLELPA